jgi:hypothetical protein
MRKGKRDGDLWKGLAAGLAGGLAASWTMNQFQAVWTKTEGFGKAHGAQSAQPIEAQEPAQCADQKKENQDDATVKAARAISENIFGHELKESEKEIAGAAVHYAFGTAIGGLYGTVAELTPELTTGMGLPFGAAFWLVADETAVPLLRLSKPPAEYPVSTHVYALASHLVFGLTAEFVRRKLRRAL